MPAQNLRCRTAWWQDKSATHQKLRTSPWAPSTPGKRWRRRVFGTQARRNSWRAAAAAEALQHGTRPQHLPTAGPCGVVMVRSTLKVPALRKPSSCSATEAARGSASAENDAAVAGGRNVRRDVGAPTRPSSSRRAAPTTENDSHCVPAALDAALERDASARRADRIWPSEICTGAGLERLGRRRFGS